MRLLRLIGAVVSISLRRELAFRTNLLFQALMTFSSVVAGLTALAIVFTRTSSLAGWTLGAAIVLFGTFEIASGVLQTFIEPNLSWFSGQVRQGKLDDILLQPLPSIVLASFGTCNPLGLSQIGLGIVVVAIGMRQQAGLTLGGVAGYVALLLVAIALTWATRLLLACLAFWAPNAEPEVFYSAFWQLGRYPVGVYRPPIGFVLTYVIPVAFIATIPARALTGGVTLQMLLGGLLAALVAVIVARLAWDAGLRRYTSATS